MKLVVNKGDRFGILSIIKEIERAKYGRRFLCLCNIKYGGCGNKKKVFLFYLKRGTTKSCGCLGNEIRIKSHTTHGLYKNSLYKHHYDMINRCYNKTRNDYFYWGRRGIYVCKRWKIKKNNQGLKNFIKDMGPTWFKGARLERVDNDGPYSPDNCIWTTHKKQMQNTSRIIPVKINGKKICLAKAVRKCGVVSYQTALNRINKGWHPIDAISTPKWCKPIVKN